MTVQCLQRSLLVFRDLKSAPSAPVFGRKVAFWLFAALLALGAMLSLAGVVQGQTTNSPYLGSVSVSGTAATVYISSFHYDSSASSNYLDVYVCRVTTGGQLDENACTRSDVSLTSSSGITFDLTTNGNWPQGGGGSRYVRARTYTSPSSGSSYESPWSNQRLWQATSVNCTLDNFPPVQLGTLGLSGGSTLTHAGTLEGRYYEAPCDSPSDSSRAARFFEFTVGADAAGAVQIEAPKGQSTMLAGLYLRSGTAYSGGVVWQDANYVHATYSDDALAAGLLAAGAYTLELRNASTDMSSSNPAAAGGAYNVTITRLQPGLAISYTTPSGVHTTWDLGAAVQASQRNTTANRIALDVDIDYKLESAPDWTSAATGLSPEDGGRTVSNDISGLTFGETYLVRAGYTNASHYESSDALTTEAFLRISASPFRVEAVAELIDQAMAKYRVRVAWQTPEIELGEDLSYRYSTRLDGGAAVQNPAGQEEVLETVFDYSPATGQTLLEIEVNNAFACAETAANDCELTYAGEDFAIPAGESWSTTWSAPGLVRFDTEGGGVGGVATSREPDPAVTEGIDLFLEQMKVPEESRQSDVLAVVLGGLISIGVGVAVAVAARGPAVNRVILGAGITFTLLGGVATVLFGFPDEVIALMATLAMILAAAFLVRRFAFE